MSSVIKNKKKSLLTKIIRGIYSDPLPGEQGKFSPDVPLDDICITDGDAAFIASRRNDLKAAKHGNSDVTVVFEEDV